MGVVVTMTDLDAIRARHTGKHRCLGAWRAVSGFRMFGLDDGERCDASRLADEVERLRALAPWTGSNRIEADRIVAAERARIRAAVEGLDKERCYTAGVHEDWHLRLRAVLAAIDGGSDDHPA